MMRALAFLAALLPSLALAQVAPGGRLSLQAGEPVQYIDQVGISTIYYLPYSGNQLPMPTGAGTFSAQAIPSGMNLSLTTTFVSGGYMLDVLLVNVGGTPTLCHTSGYSNASRSGGTLTHGVWTYSSLYGILENGTSITNCHNGLTNYGPIATYNAVLLGTFFTTAGGQTTMQTHPVPSPTVFGGVPANLYLQNAYNRVEINGVSTDSNNYWRSQSTSASNPVVCDSANQTTGLIRVNFIDAYGDLPWRIDGAISIVGAAPNYGYFGIIGVGLDSTTAISYSGTVGNMLEQQGTSSADNTGNQFGTATHTTFIPYPPVMGSHYAQCIEISNGETVFNGSGYMLWKFTGWM